MEIIKILNNNVAVVLDKQGKEQVVMGRGLAFHKRPGEELDATQVEKVFTLQDSQLAGRLGELLMAIPPEVIAASECIITLARQSLTGILHESLVISLTDHINFALQRQRQQIPLRNVLRWEIHSLYPKEYELGLAALEIINQRLGVRLEEDEAGFIALHLVNAQLHSDMPEVLYITRFMQQILDIVKYQLQIEYQRDSLSYNRFVTHLKFFAQRILGKKSVASGDRALQEMVRNRYPQAWRCVDKIARHVEKHYAWSLEGEEQLFLTIHIERIRNETLAPEEREGET
ncbi:BglG family transcription antiterminator LicT [Kalamiella sp. sgz302252]|uniref:BglG family transcription antiterminator LicT n=1 Tax=Pantoea sp. sgz302252 TaxID=3341827 RepID=UPI0036D3D6AF